MLHWQNDEGPPEYVLFLKKKNKHSEKKYHGLIQRWVSFKFFQLSYFTIQRNPNWQNEVEAPEIFIIIIENWKYQYSKRKFHSLIHPFH